MCCGTRSLRKPVACSIRQCTLADLGNHTAAIEGLQEALAKYPSDAPYAHNLLGLEYIETGRFTDAKNSFEEAVRLMPHESVNHSNFGLSLAIVGEWDSAELEVRKSTAPPKK